MAFGKNQSVFSNTVQSPFADREDAVFPDPDETFFLLQEDGIGLFLQEDGVNRFLLESAPD